MTIARPSPKLLAGLQAIGAEMLSAWKGEASEEAFAILETYEAE